MSQEQLTRNYLDSINYYVEGFILKHRSQRHSPRTIDFYKSNLGRFQWFLEQNQYSATLSNITPNHIRHFFIYLNESGGEAGARWGSNAPSASKPLSPRSLHAFARTLRAFFRWATKEAHLPHNPFENIDMPHVPSQWRVDVFSDDEITALFAACDVFTDTFLVTRNRAILALLLDSGIRAGELLSLEVKDIDIHTGFFSVHGKGDKVRSVYIGGFARRELWAYLARRERMNAPTSALFIAQEGQPMTYAGLQYMFRQLGIRAKLERAPRAHLCRHTFASKAHSNGMRGSTLQEALGHTTFDTTRRFYLNISKEDLAREHALYGPLDNMRHNIGVTKKQRTAKPDDSSAPKLPSAETLAKEVAQSSYLATARKYGVTDTAVRKRIKKAGLL